MKVEEIEIKRLSIGVTKEKLCRMAGIDRSTYRKAERNGSQLQPKTFQSLTNAIRSVKTGRRSKSDWKFATYQLSLGLVATAYGIDGSELIQSNPKLRATRSKEWVDLSIKRRMAFHILNGIFGFGATEIGEAAGMTKAAVSIAINQIEDLRDEDPVVNDVLNKIYGMLSDE